MKRLIFPIISLLFIPFSFSATTQLTPIPESPHENNLTLVTGPYLHDHRRSFHQNISMPLDERENQREQKLAKARASIIRKNKEIENLKLRVCYLCATTSCLFVIVLVGVIEISFHGWC